MFWVGNEENSFPKCTLIGRPGVLQSCNYGQFLPIAVQPYIFLHTGGHLIFYPEIEIILPMLSYSGFYVKVTSSCYVTSQRIHEHLGAFFENKMWNLMMSKKKNP